MPVITIHLIPPGTNQAALKQLVLDLQQVIVGMPELHLTENDLTVCMPADILAWGVGVDMPVLIDGLFKKDERTPEVLERLWEGIGTVVATFARQYVPQCTKVEVIPSDYDQNRDGFWRQNLQPD